MWEIQLDGWTGARTWRSLKQAEGGLGKAPGKLKSGQRRCFLSAKTLTSLHSLSLFFQKMRIFFLMLY